MVYQENHLEHHAMKGHHVAKENVNVRVLVVTKHATNGVESDESTVPMLHMHPTLSWSHVEELVHPEIAQ